MENNFHRYIFIFIMFYYMGVLEKQREQSLSSHAMLEPSKDS